MRSLGVLLVVLAIGVSATPAHAAAGDFDRTFSGDGRQYTDFGREDGVYALAIQRDGKIVAAGASSEFRGPTYTAVARYNRDGTLTAPSRH